MKEENSLRHTRVNQQGRTFIYNNQQKLTPKELVEGTMTDSPDIDFAPSTLEVDYDKNLTDLYKAITDQKWELAADLCKQDPEQAKTWVVRRYEEEDEDASDDGIMWRFLPIHSACARSPPIAVVAALLRAYPDGAKCQDDQGMYPLHYACGNQAARDVVRILLVSHPDAAKKADPRGMLPIHYLACWGPSSVSVVDMLLVAHPDVADVKDADGKTPLDLAKEGDYPERKAVASVLQKWFDGKSDDMKSSLDATTRNSSSTASRKNTTTSKQSVVSNSSSTSGKHLLASSRLISDDGEEKKEDDTDFLMQPRGGFTALSDASSFRAEVEILKTEKAVVEKQLAEAKQKNASQEVEYFKVRQELSEARMSRSKGDMDKEDLEKELDRTTKSFKAATDELKGLRITMVDMMEEHESLKKKSAGMNTRLDSLSTLLAGLMSQQKEMAQIIRNSAEQRQKSYKLRKENMRTLLEMEAAESEQDEDMERKLKKQTREFEALQAMIEAARD